MRTTLIIDKNTRIINLPRHEPMPCGTKSQNILGRRFDECIAIESGEILLQALFDGYRGTDSEHLPIIISLQHDKPFCAYLSIKPIFSPDGGADTLECELEY